MLSAYRDCAIAHLHCSPSFIQSPEETVLLLLAFNLAITSTALARSFIARGGLPERLRRTVEIKQKKDRKIVD